MHSTLERPAAAAPGPDDVTRRDPDAAAATPPLAEPQRLERYVLLGELGRGGMGVVYAAYDTTLDRKVALKLLRDAGGRDAHQRMLREARALARLSHPNVVGVYEVGEIQQQVFVAMELVEGMNLRAWLAAGARTRAEILAVFLQAAEGMSAAHAAGLVHRDVKPDNVVIGADGRVRVMDFGLARRSLDVPAPRDDEVITRPSDPQLTAAGAVLGTPAYMAPEQHLGVGVGVAADIYSFAVALYEALHGQRPYQGTTTRELSERVLRGKRTHTIAKGRVPAWLQAVVERGMALEPADRWPTMTAFSAALRRDPTRRRRLLAALALAALAVATVLGAQHHREQTQIAACVADGASIDATWNEAVAADLRAHLPTASAAYARSTLDRVVPLLAERAAQWREARTAACLDAHVHRTLDADTLERETACLDDERVKLAALIADLARPGDRDFSQFVPATVGLPPISECRDVDALRRAPPLPADREALRAARALLSRADISRQTGLPAESLPAVRAAVAAAERLAWPPLIAEATFLHGRILLDISAHAEAEPVLERAYFQAVAAGAPLVAADAAESLAYAAMPFPRYADILRWVQHSEALLTALGVPETGPQRLDLLHIRGKVLLDSGDYVASLAIFERELAAQLELFGPGHARLTYTYEELALVHKRLGHLREARSFAEQAVASAEVSYGPDHPRYAWHLVTLSDILVRLDEFNEALALLLRAAEIYRRAYGPDHTDLVDIDNKLAYAYMRVGRYAESLALYERTLAASEKLNGSDSYLVGTVLNQYALLYQRLGRASEGLPLALRALHNIEKEHGPDHPEVANMLNNVANLELDVDDDLHARAHFERSLAIFAALPVPHPSLPIALRGLAVCANRDGRHADALALAERSVQLLEESAAYPIKLADARLALAEALVGAAGDLTRARAAAQDARARYGATVGFEREAARADALLARLP